MTTTATATRRSWRGGDHDALDERWRCPGCARRRHYRPERSQPAGQAANPRPSQPPWRPRQAP